MVSKTSGKTKLFISYSRKDRGRIERLYDALASEEDLRVFRDTDDILPTEEWKPRLEKLIRESDTIVFALSPASAASEVCAWELELAASLNKRIIPIVVENVDGAVPEAVSKLNYIFLTEADDFGRGLTKIQDAISLDIDWVREHTRLGELADRWEKAVRLGAQPLRGKELEAAERWLVEQPKNAPQPTELQRRYILESRKAATRRARTTVMGSVAAMLIVGVLGVFAWVQRDVAIAQRSMAVENESRALSALSDFSLRNGEPAEAVALALAAWPRAGDAARPQLNRVLKSLEGGLINTRESAFKVQLDGILSEVSADGSFVIQASDLESYVHIVELEHGKILKTINLPGNIKALTTCRRSPSIVAAGTVDGQVAIIDITSGETDILGDLNSGWTIALSFSSDCKLLASAHTAEDTTIWDVAAGRKLLDLPNNRCLTTTIAFMPAQDIVIQGCKKSTSGLQAYHALTGERIWSQIASDADVNSIDFSPDGSRIVTASSDGKVQQWDTSNGIEIGDPMLHDRDVNEAHYSPDGLTIVSASYDNTARLWSTMDGVQVGEPMRHNGDVQSARFSHNGLMIATSSADNTVKVFDRSSGAQIGPDIPVGEPAFGAGFAQEDKKLAVWSSHNLSVWNVATAAPLGRRFSLGEDVFTVRFSLNRKYAILFSDSAVWWLDLSGQNNVLKQMAVQGSIYTYDVALDVGRVAIGTDSGSTIVFNLDDGKPTCSFPPQKKRINSIRFSADNKSIVTTSSDQGVQIWSVESCTLQYQMPVSGSAPILAFFLPKSERLAVFEQDFDGSVVGTSRIAIWSPAVETIARPEVSIGSKLGSADVTRDGLTLAATFGAEVFLFDLHEDPKLINRIVLGDIIQRIRFSPDQGSFLTLSGNNELTIWDSISAQSISSLKGEADKANEYFSTFAWSPDSRQIFAGSSDKIFLWDASTGIQIWRPIQQAGLNQSLDISADGSLLIAAASGDQTRLFDLTGLAGKEVWDIACDRIASIVDLGEVQSSHQLQNFVPICGQNFPITIDRQSLN